MHQLRHHVTAGHVAGVRPHAPPIILRLDARGCRALCCHATTLQPPSRFAQRQGPPHPPARPPTHQPQRQARPLTSPHKGALLGHTSPEPRQKPQGLPIGKAPHLPHLRRERRHNAAAHYHGLCLRQRSGRTFELLVSDGGPGHCRSLASILKIMKKLEAASFMKLSRPGSWLPISKTSVNETPLPDSRILHYAAKGSQAGWKPAAAAPIPPMRPLLRSQAGEGARAPYMTQVQKERIHTPVPSPGGG